MTTIAGIKQIDSSQIDESAFKQKDTGCIVLTHDNRILLQYRPDNWHTFPGMMTTFGGYIETNESSSQAVIRELHEKLGLAGFKTAFDIHLAAFIQILTGNFSQAIKKSHSVRSCFCSVSLSFQDSLVATRIFVVAPPFGK